MYGYVIPVWALIILASFPSSLGNLACDLTSPHQDLHQCYWAKFVTCLIRMTLFWCWGSRAKSWMCSPSGYCSPISRAYLEAALSDYGLALLIYFLARSGLNGSPTFICRSSSSFSCSRLFSGLWSSSHILSVTSMLDGSELRRKANYFQTSSKWYRPSFPGRLYTPCFSARALPFVPPLKMHRDAPKRPCSPEKRLPTPPRQEVKERPPSPTDSLFDLPGRKPRSKKVTEHSNDIKQTLPLRWMAITW